MSLEVCKPSADATLTAARTARFVTITQRWAYAITPSRHLICLVSLQRSTCSGYRILWIKKSVVMSLSVLGRSHTDHKSPVGVLRRGHVGLNGRVAVEGIGRL